MAKPKSLKQAFFPMVLLLALFPILSAGCGGSGSPSASSIVPSDTLFAVSYNGKIYLVHGDGSGAQILIGGGYSEATLSPDKTRIACIHPGDFFITVFTLNSQSELEGRPKTIYNSDAMHAIGGLGRSYSPLWSPDGNKIYFLNENFLVSYDYQAQRTSTVLSFPDDQFGVELSHAFPKDGNTLYAVTHDLSDMMTIWSVDLAGGQAVSIITIGQGDYLRFRFPSPVPDGLYQGLFGSKENPVIQPVIPPGDRFYFYVGKKESPFETSRIITGYDQTQNLKFEVSALETSYHLPQNRNTVYSQF